MEILEDENPLDTYKINTFKTNPYALKNCAGRPTNSKIIKFSEQPISVIAHMITEEQRLANYKSKELVCSDVLKITKGNENLGLMKMCTMNADKGLKLFSCSYLNCTYSTKISSNLTKHKRTHTNEKLYLCDECTFSTKFSNSLNVHKRLHSNVKPFNCQYCQYKCNSSSNLKKHQKHKHLDRR